MRSFRSVLGFQLIRAEVEIGRSRCVKREAQISDFLRKRNIVVVKS